MSDVQLFTLPQVAAKLGLHPRRIEREAKKNNAVAGQPVIEINGRRYLSSEQIERILRGAA